MHMDAHVQVVLGETASERSEIRGWQSLGRRGKTQHGHMRVERIFILFFSNWTQKALDGKGRSHPVGDDL
eukprot:4134301-Pleurochrysis_carterae.AAC.1